jgi:hypothetical protein
MREKKCIQYFGGKTGERRMLGSTREKWMDSVTYLKSYNGRAWREIIWLKIGTSGRPL